MIEAYKKEIIALNTTVVDISVSQKRAKNAQEREKLQI
jgi:hypothetical protein